MATRTLTKELKEQLLDYLNQHKKADLVSAYLFYLEQRYSIHPVVYPVAKMIYRSQQEAVSQLEKEGKLWREAQVKISYQRRTVNEETKKIYICPFSGKAFGDNTCANPLDAIYDWVSKCPENTERTGGLRVKRFFVSDDPEVIKNYVKERKKPITKTAYTSVPSGKLFNSREAVIEDFKSHYLKPIGLADVQNQTRFEIEPTFLDFIQTHLDEDKITAFVEELAEEEQFHPFVAQWVEEE